MPMVDLNTNLLTADTVQSMLNHWPTPNQNDSHESSSANQGWQTYQRLMEVYCVVKAGGVMVQVEAAQAFLKRETTLLEADIAALPHQNTNSQAAMLRQEIRDLKNSVHWRIAQLQQILPEEEAVVKGAIAAIEDRLQTKGNRLG